MRSEINNELERIQIEYKYHKGQYFVKMTANDAIEDRISTTL